MDESYNYSCDPWTQSSHAAAVDRELVQTLMKAHGYLLPAETPQGRVERLRRHLLVLCRILQGDAILDEEGRADLGELMEQLVKNLIAAYEGRASTSPTG